jgi:phosphoribosylglycinamide formyltransferase-1
LTVQTARHRAAILISGSGTNLQAFIDATQAGTLDLDIALVISNRDDAYGLTRARDAGIPTICISHTGFDSRAAFDAALAESIDESGADIVVLAGFMRILTGEFVRHYAGRLLNIHPSLLPRFPGLDTHRRAIEAHERWHGSTVHFVTEELDGGPRIIQARVPILPDDSPGRLAARVLELEHRIYPMAVGWLASGRLELRDGKAVLDGRELDEPCQHTG